MPIPGRLAKPIAAACLAGLAVAMANPVAADSGRYEFVPVREGALRLDRETGAVAVCAGPVGGRSCRTLDAAGRPRAREPAEALRRVSRLAQRIMARLVGRVQAVKSAGS